MILPSALTGCPYCSSPLVYPGRKGAGGQHVVRCSSCGAEGPPAQSQAESEQKWNRRPYRIAVQASQQARQKEELDPLFNPEEMNA